MVKVKPVKVIRFGGPGGTEYKLPFLDLLPPQTAEQLGGMRGSIRKYGVKQPCVVDQNDNIIDGATRAMIAFEQEAHSIPVERVFCETLEDARQLCLHLNIHRRQLSQKGMREMIALILKEDPKRTDKDVADSLGTTNHTVAAERKDMEKKGEIPIVEERTDRRGSTRASKRPKKKASEAPRMRDGDGKVVPDHLRDVFGDPTIKRIETALHEAVEYTKMEGLISAMEAKAKSYPWLKLEETINRVKKGNEALRLALEAIQSAIPYAVCQRCDGSGGKKCACRESGYLPKWRFEELVAQG